MCTLYCIPHRSGVRHPLFVSYIYFVSVLPLEANSLHPHLSGSVFVTI